MTLGGDRLVDVEPSARTFRLEELLTLVENGQIRIPRFQRGLKWQVKDAALLFDSIVRGFPVGSLLMWSRRAEAESLTLGDIRIEAPDMTSALWIVDGQQRVTCLANALSLRTGYDGSFALEMDIRSRVIRPRRKGSSGVIALPDLFHLRRFFAWTQENPDCSDHLEVLNDAATRLREFHIPAYVVRTGDEDTLIQIFDRMNNSGKRLTRAEVFNALHSSTDAPPISEIQRDIQAKSFGTIDDGTLLKALLARRGPNVDREIRAEFQPSVVSRSEFPDEDQTAAYAKGGEALAAAVSFLIQMGVVHVSLLPYRYLLIVLVRFLAHFPRPDERTEELLRRWFWRSAVVGPGKGSTTGAARMFAGCISPGDEHGSVSELLRVTDTIPRGNAPLLPGRFEATTAHTKIFLCHLWNMGPRSLVTGKRISAKELAEALGTATTATAATQEIFASWELSERTRTSVGNRLLLPDPPDDVRESLSRIDSPRTLASHVIGQGTAALLDRAGVSPQSKEAVVLSREKELVESFSSFVRVRCGWDMDDTPALSSLNHDDS